MNDNEQEWPPASERVTHTDELEILQDVLSGKKKLDAKGNFVSEEPIVAEPEPETEPETEPVPESEPAAVPVQQPVAKGEGFKDCYSCPDCGALLVEGNMGLVCSKTLGHKGYYNRKLPKEIKVRNHTKLAFPDIRECRQATHQVGGGSWVIDDVPGYFTMEKTWHRPVIKQPPEMKEGDRLALDGGRVRLLRPIK